MKEFYEKLLTKFLLVFLKFSSSFFSIFMLHHSLLNKFSAIGKKKLNFWPETQPVKADSLMMQVKDFS